MFLLESGSKLSSVEWCAKSLRIGYIISVSARGAANVFVVESDGAGIRCDTSLVGCSNNFDEDISRADLNYSTAADYVASG
jgi:hypothetical protein